MPAYSYHIAEAALEAFVSADAGQQSGCYKVLRQFAGIQSELTFT